ncbi:MAG: sensor histidine kinase [Roseibium sp.]|nr:sensor histidine kinase [Roseibium sp.]
MASKTALKRLVAPCLCAVIGLLFPVLALATQTAATPDLSLEGDHALIVGESRPEFADPDFDDTGWRRISVPSSLREAGVEARPDVFWYRITFDIPDGWSVASPAIRLGIIERADETYLNGVRIGGEGIVGPPGSDWHAYPPIAPRLYPVDPSLLTIGGRNVLAVKAAREPYIDDGGIIAGPVALVGIPGGLPEYLATQRRFLSISYLFFGVETLLMLAACAALALNRPSRAVVYFFLLFTPYYVFALERRGVFAYFGLDGQAFQFAINVFGALSLPVLIEFVAYVLAHPVGLLGRIVQVLSLLALVSIPLSGNALLDWWVMESTLVWHSLFLAALLLLVHWSVRAFRRGRPHSVPLLVGLSMIAATMAADLAMPANYTEIAYGFRFAEIGSLTLLMSFGFILGQHIVANQQALRQANIDVLEAHETERARLARDVHDSIGHWLSMTKLHLEMLRADTEHGKRPTAQAIGKLAADMGQALEDTRRVAHDLSPAILEEQGFAGAIRAHAERLTRGNAAVVRLDIAEPVTLSSEQRAHLYRIVQEATNNAVTHGKAKEIEIRLRHGRTHNMLVIADDGTGIAKPDGASPPSPLGQSGLGLKTMKDRARLIGGSLTISSKDGQGTRIELTFPAKHGSARTG